MERSAKIGFSASALVALIFSLLGIVFLTIGLCLLQFGADPESTQVGIAFTPLGAVFLAFALGVGVVNLLKKRTANRLIENGRFIWGQIVEFTPNYNIRVNNRHPYVAMVRYTDSAGTVHIFRSRELYRYPDPGAIGKQVRVYVENDSYKPYYVDIDPVLTPVIEH